VSYWKRFALIFLGVVVLIRFPQGFVGGFTHNKVALLAPDDPLNWFSVPLVIA
jgi:hypothetical protein